MQILHDLMPTWTGCAKVQATRSVRKENAAMKVLNVCVGLARETSIDGGRVLTAIGKTAATGPVAGGLLGLSGDEQADLSVHGGLAKAVYAYPSEHLPFWQTVRAQAKAAGWGDPIAPGLLGENLLLQGLLEDQLWIGDRLQLPGCLLAVSEPRHPCFKFNAAMGFGQAARMMMQSGFCGSYLTVLTPGLVTAGDPVTLLTGPREVNLRALFRSRARG
jgi:MOSC domain-containing protein YiiM